MRSPVVRLFLSLFILLSILTATAVSRTPVKGQNGGTVYIPIAGSDPRLAPLPAVAASFPLTNGRCPYQAVYNSTSGYVYVANEESDNVSVIKDGIYLGEVAPGVWTKMLGSHPNNDTVYASGIRTGISILHGTTRTALLPAFYEPHTVVINTTNGYTYISDLAGHILIIKDEQIVKDIAVLDDIGDSLGWLLAGDFDATTGLTYFASWEHGQIIVLDGLELVERFSYGGVGAADMVIDPHRRWMYIANQRPGEEPGLSWANIAVLNLDTRATYLPATSQQSRNVALDPTSGLAYFTNYLDNTITIMQGPTEVATHFVGEAPWGVEVNPNTGYVYVTNSGEKSVSILRDGQMLSTIELPNDGDVREPWGIAIDTNENLAYIIRKNTRLRSNSDQWAYTECLIPWATVLR